MDFLRQLRVLMEQLWQGARDVWGKLALSARINILLAAAATLGIILYVVLMGARTEYVPLYSHLSVEDAAAIKSYLTDEANVSYKLRDEGATILVPVRQRSKLRIALSERDLPKKQGAAPGFELFEETDLMTNQWLQDVKYMRAVQGELQRQLNQFEFIDRSFVFIREAQEELFVSEQKPSEAAVTLDVNRAVTKAEIKCLLSVIASFGGANLDRNHITLTTTEGEPLHVPPESEFASVANSKLEYIAELEQQREQRAMEMFRNLGVKALVNVSAVVDFDTTKELVRSVQDGAPISEYASSTAITSSELLPEGPPGARSNLPPGAEQQANTQLDEQTEESILNYENSHTETERVNQGGDVERYIVSAIVEGAYETSTDEEGNEIKQYVGLDEKTRKTYESQLLAAVGSGETTTEVTVHDHPFEIDALAPTQAAFAALESARQREMVLQYGWKAAQVLLMLIAFLVLRRLFYKATFIEEEEQEEVVEMPAETLEDMRRKEVARELQRMAENQPEAMAALIRSWMAEEEEF